MMENMPGHVFADWQRYFVAEPFGENRADLRMGIMTANIRAALSGISAQLAGKSKGQTFKPTDFMPFVATAAQKRKPLPDKVLFEKVLILNRLYGGTVIDLRKKT